MAQLSLTTLGGSSPDDVVAESNESGIQVRILASPASWTDRRVWISALFQFGTVLVLFTVFFGLSGVLRVHPQFWAIIFGLSIFAGLLAAFQMRVTLSKRRSAPAQIQLSAERLIIDEPGFNMSRQGKIADVAPLHMEYDLGDIEEFSVTSADDFDPVEESLRVHLTSRLSEFHLKGRDADQLQWACQWLSSALRSAKLRRQPVSQNHVRPATTGDSFVYDQSGLREGK